MCAECEDFVSESCLKTKGASLGLPLEKELDDKKLFVAIGQFANTINDHFHRAALLHGADAH